MYAMQPRKPREGFTLVELIVVITIILLITALGAAMLPRFLDNQNQTRAVDLLSQWLLTAKMRAKRDGLPTGLRILYDPNTNLASQLEYVQQPDPYTAGVCQSVTSNGGSGGQYFAQFQATSVDFLGAGTKNFQAGSSYGELSLVQSGDYLELNGGGGMYNIYTVDSTDTLTLANTNVSLGVQTPNYRIIRQPRRLLGEDVLTLPQDIVINPALSIAVPKRNIGNLNIYEILFTPMGSVIGKGTQSGKIILWVCNATDPNGPVLNPNGPPPGGYNAATSSLVTIQIRTGFIAVHPISLGTNAYLFTEDGRSSGM